MAGIMEFVIFGGIAYWLFSDRVRAIFTLILTKLHELYNRWDFRGRRPQARDKRLTKEKYESVSDVQSSGEARRHASEFNCSPCSLSNRGSLINKGNAGKFNIVDEDRVKSHLKGWFSKIIPHLSQALSFKKYIFPYIFESVLEDERLQDVYETAARQSLEESDTVTDASIFADMVNKQKLRATKILVSLRSAFSDIILRISSFTMTKVMLKLFITVDVNQEQIQMLNKANACNVPLIFLPLHRSHLDYIIITYIVANNNMKSPLVAAGENLQIPFFGSLLRGLGAFFIKRRMDPVNGKRDILYRAVLHTYMMHCLQAQYNFEFFIEGGRTRSGKPCMPKGGLLSVFLDAYMDGTIEDALLVPVSINYERIVDGNFIHEQLGKPKEKETFRSAISAIWTVLTSRYGSMRVDFNQPFSLREMADTYQKKISLNQQQKKKVLQTVPSSASLYGTDVIVEEHRQLVDSIARHVIYDCTCCTAVMSTNAVSFLLLNSYREGVLLQDLASALDSLSMELQMYNKSLGYDGQSVDVIKHAVKILGSDLVKYERDPTSGQIIVTPVTTLPYVIELSYYSNAVLPYFVLEAIVVRAMHSLLSRSESPYISQTVLIEVCQKLCDVLRYEFIFIKFCQSLEDAILNAIDALLRKKILTTNQVNSPSSDDSSTEKEVPSSVADDQLFEIKYKLQEDKSCNVYLSLLQPFLDVYSVSVKHLQRLLYDNLPEKQFVEEILETIKADVSTNKLKYGECISLDTIRNSMKLFQKWEVLEYHNENKVKMCSLGEKYDDQYRLEEVVSRVNIFQL